MTEDPVMGIFEVDGEHILAWRDYFDSAGALARMKLAWLLATVQPSCVSSLLRRWRSERTNSQRRRAYSWSSIAAVGE